MDLTSSSQLFYQNRTLSYDNLRLRVDDLKNRMAAIGIVEGDVIGVFFEKSPDMVMTLIALIEMEACFLTISPKIPKDRLEYIISDSGLQMVITNSQTANLCSFAHLEGIPELTILNLDKKIWQTEKSIVHNPNYGGGYAYIMYTSGSTGKPKGVLIKKKSILNLFEGIAESVKLNHKDVFLSLTDYTFDVSLIEILMPFYMGASLFLAEEGAILNPEKIKKILEDYKITLMQATPTTWQVLVNSGWRNLNPNLKLLSGGEALSSKLASAMNIQQGNLWNVYGPTETTMWSTIYHLENIPIESKYVPIGTALKNQQAYVLDDSLKQLREGEAGELCIGGMGVAKGYINQALLTKSRFVKHSLFGRLYRTGDFVRKLPDGNINYLRRMDNQIKIGGVRIEPIEIEMAIEASEFVEKAVVLCEEGLDNCKRITAFIALSKAIYKRESIQDETRVGEWENIYDVAYTDVHNYQNQTINPSAWNSSLSKEQFSTEELHENLSILVDKTLLLGHKNFLEIGSGVGNLITLLNSNYENYTATEISNVALNYLVKYNKTRDNVSIKKASAHSPINKNQYDCIVMNSIIQYFPSGAYLLDVIRNQIKSIKSSGTVVIGDVRHKDLMDLLLVEKSTKNPGLSEVDLYLKSRDGELLASPKFFLLLKEKFNRISHVDINIKTGETKNELNLYRFDVFIHVDKPIEYKKSEKINCHELLTYSRSKIEQLVKNKKYPIIIEKISSPIFSKLLDIDMNNVTPYVANYILRYIPSPSSRDEYNKIFGLIKFIKGVCKNVFVEYGIDSYTEIQLKIYPEDSSVLIRDEPLALQLNQSGDMLYEFIREPYDPGEFQKLVVKIREVTSRQLYDYMQPVKYNWIEKWPTTVNKKVDKKALTSQTQVQDMTNYDSNTKKLIDLWEKITGNRANIDQNFGSLGVSSLYFYYFTSEINRTFDINLEFSTMCAKMSIGRLSEIVQELQNAKSQQGYS